MSNLDPLSELDAVNELLGSIGQASVNSLSSLHGDPAIARGYLLSVNRSVQLYGFTFNTDENYELQPDGDSLLRVPEGTLRIDPMDKRQSLVARTHPDGFRAMWDLANHTWTMSEPVTFRVTWGFTFEDLPESAKNYITLAGARRFQKRIIGSDELDGYNAEDEERAWSLLLRDERATSDTNVFRRSPSLARMTSRVGRTSNVITE